MVKFYDELTRNNKIQIYSPSASIEEYKLPNTYYINPMEKVYIPINDSLRLLYEAIKDTFYKKKYDFIYKGVYSSVERVLKADTYIYNRLVKTSKVEYEEVMRYLNLDIVSPDDPVIYNLMLGTLSSRIILLKRFLKLFYLEESKDKIMDEIVKESNDDINEILIRLAFFHRIDSKVIKTSSLDIESFKEYLNKNYTINIEKPIMAKEGYDDSYIEYKIEEFIRNNSQYKHQIVYRQK